MKKILFLVCFVFSTVVFAGKWVDGYSRRDGSYVQGHYKTDSNNTLNDNYSTRGNTNPYNGNKGYKPRDEDSTNFYPTQKRKSKNTFGY